MRYWMLSEFRTPKVEEDGGFEDFDGALYISTGGGSRSPSYNSHGECKGRPKALQTSEGL
jgi:hypothetical protein